jgi:SAM-dependent methyltransferase
MYTNGQQPFGAQPFDGLDQVLRSRVKAGGKVLDIGAGYGRDAFWLARELGCSVTALEPGKSGVDAMEAAAASGSASPGTVTSLIACASEFAFEAHAQHFDAVLMDSVLSFIAAEHHAAVVKGSLEALAPGGSLVVLGWPSEVDPLWVGKLIRGAGVPGVEVVEDNRVVECDAEFDGEAAHMVWSVTVACIGHGERSCNFCPLRSFSWS